MLVGRTVWLTRPAGRSDALIGLLRRQGGVVAEVPVVRVQPAGDATPLDQAACDLTSGAYDWVAFTSSGAVGALSTRIAGAGGFPEEVPVAAVGPATAAAVRGAGGRVALVSRVATAAGLAEDFPSGDGRVLFCAAAGASHDLQRGLEAKGWTVDRVEAYRVVPEKRSADEGRLLLERGVDVVVFHSAGAVDAFRALWGSPPDRTAVCCAGPVTAGAAELAGLRVDSVAERPDAETVASAIARAVRG